MKKSVVALLILVAGSIAQAAAAEGIDWFSGDVDAAFAAAKKEDKPLFLYWGAAWCPPCNQVKATIFNRQDFIARSRFFVPVHIDGDSPGAQKLGARFKVRGYPTTILFRPDGTEITRLPGEVDSSRYLRVLALGMNATHPVRATLANALGDKPTVDANGWRLLSFYAWDTDEQQLVQQSQRVTTLQRLARAAPPGEAATRLQLLALVAAANERPQDRPGTDNVRASTTLMQVFGRQDQARSNADVLTNFSARLVAANSAPASPARRQLLRAGDAALARLARDRSLSTTDQLMARDAQLQLGALPGVSSRPAAALVHAAQAQVAAADRATTDVYERQSVISAAADVLTDAGLLDESDRLLNAELSRSHSPYYFMLGLAANARKRGDNPTALKWYQQAWEQATGPATRLQWGTTYLTNLIELSPADEARIEKTARAVFDELAQTPDAFYERNRIRLEGLGHKLTDWKAARHEAAFARVAAQLNGICGKLPTADAQRSTCLGILAPA